MELIKGDDSRYKDYENVLLRRDALSKEADHYYTDYVFRFGELINTVFKLKIECIRKKKMIAYCQKQINKGKTVQGVLLEQYIETAMADYYDQLSQMEAELRGIKKRTAISLWQAKKVKDLFRELAKKIHPDIRPDLANDEYIQELWNGILTAYRCNALKELEELKFRTELYLEQLGGGNGIPEIPDLEEKIRAVQDEIQEILSTNPYLYKFLLEDEEQCREKEEELRNEAEEYRQYSERLDEVLDGLPIERTVS